MNAFAKLNTATDVAEEKDYVGGGSSVLDSGLYPMTVALAYVGESEGGAASLNLHLKTDDGTELRQTLYVSSGRAKGQKTYYEKDGVKHNLPGFTLAQSLSRLTVGKELGELQAEAKVVSLYDYDAKKEVPTNVQALTELHGQQIITGVLKQTVDKTKKNDSGVYVATGETRDENEIDKFFRAKDSLTVAEILAQASEATFINSWREKNAGVTRMKAKGASGTAGAPAGAAAPTPAAPKKSLFA